MKKQLSLFLKRLSHLSSISIIVGAFVGCCLPSSANQGDEIRTHRWWKKPLSEAQLNGMIQALVDANAGDIIFIGSDGRIGKITVPGQGSGWSDETIGFVQPPDGIEHRCLRIYLNPKAYFSRLTPEQALNEIRGQLDRRDFIDGKR